MTPVDPLPIVGVREIATMLGVSRQRADQLSRTQGFPEPLCRLAAGSVWRQREIIRWAIRYGRPCRRL